MPYVNGTVAADTTSVNAITATFSAPVTVGNLVAGSISFDGAGGAATITSITDDGGGTPTWVIKVNVSAGQQFYSIYGYGWTGTGPTNVTVHFAVATVDKGLSLIEFSGQAAGDPIDSTNFKGQTNNAPGAGANAIVADGTGVTPTADNYLVYCGIVETDNYGNASEYTAGTNFTLPAAAAQLGSSSELAIASQYWFQTTATLTKGPWTTSNGGGTFAATMMVFKLSAAAPVVFKSWEAMPRPETIKQVLVPVVM